MITPGVPLVPVKTQVVTTPVLTALYVSQAPSVTAQVSAQPSVDGPSCWPSVTPMEYSPLVQILILLAAVLGGLLVVIVTVVIVTISVCTFVASRLRAAKR